MCIILPHAGVAKWYTHSTQNRASQDMWVQVPPPAQQKRPARTLFKRAYIFLQVPLWGPRRVCCQPHSPGGCESVRSRRSPDMGESSIPINWVEGKTQRGKVSGLLEVLFKLHKKCFCLSFHILRLFFLMPLTQIQNLRADLMYLFKVHQSAEPVGPISRR